MGCAFSVDLGLCYNPTARKHTEGQGECQFDAIGHESAPAGEAAMSEQGPELDIEQLWRETNQILREGPINRALWDAAEAAKPLALDGDLLVLGLPASEFRHASYLQTDVNRAKLRQILHARSGRYLDLRVIEGTTPEAWERAKQREREAEEKALAGVRRAATYKSAEAAWEAANQQISAVFTGVRARAYATVKARLLAKAFPVVLKAEQEARAQESGAGEAHERYLNRLLDRIATHVDLPPTAVALEYLRYAASHKRGEPG